MSTYGLASAAAGTRRNEHIMHTDTVRQVKCKAAFGLISETAGEEAGKVTDRYGCHTHLMPRNPKHSPFGTPKERSRTATFGLLISPEQHARVSALL